MKVHKNALKTLNFSLLNLGFRMIETYDIQNTVRHLHPRLKTETLLSTTNHWRHEKNVVAGMEVTRTHSTQRNKCKLKNCLNYNIKLFINYHQHKILHTVAVFLFFPLRILS